MNGLASYLKLEEGQVFEFRGWIMKIEGGQRYYKGNINHKEWILGDDENVLAYLLSHSEEIRPLPLNEEVHGKSEAPFQEHCAYCTAEPRYIFSEDERSQLVLGVLGAYLEVSEEEYPWIMDKFPIRFCPMCGRLLSDEEKVRDIGREMN
jgi:hypothetical protein